MQLKIIIKSKLPNPRTNIYSSISLLSIENKEINFSQGYSDFEVDPLPILSLIC